MKIKPFKKSPPSKEKKPASVERVNRTVYLTVAVLLIVLAIAVAMTSAANRARRGLMGDGTGTVTVPPTATTKNPKGNITLPSPETEKAPVTLPPAPITSAPVPSGTEAAAPGEIEASKTVPTLSLPAVGSLGKLHDPAVQVFSDTLNEWRVHLGVDIMTEAGAPVYAAADGKVLSVSEDPMLGTSVCISHSGDAVTVYRNLSAEVASGIKTGASVKSGQLLGCVGDGGVMELADDSHLHFEMTVNGESVDPLDYFSAAALTSLRSPDNINYEG